MKKIIVLLLIVALTVTLVACGGNEPDISTQQDDVVSGEPTQENETPSDESTEETISVDENLLSTDITIPAIYFETFGALSEKPMTPGSDLTDYIKENEFIDANQ
jgi:hypothetical protein